MSEPDYKALFLAEQQKREAAEAAVAEEQRKREVAVADEQRKRQRLELDHHNLKELTRPTTLLEFLLLCHTYTATICSAETDIRLTTNGTIPNPIGKKRPDYIRPWLEFTTLQHAIVTRLLDCYPLHDQPQVFDSELIMQAISTKTLTRLTSEKDVELISRPLIISPIDAILKHLMSLSSVRQEFRLDSPVCFFNHLNPLKNAAAVIADTETYISPARITTTLSSLSSQEQLTSNRPTTPPSSASGPHASNNTSRGQPDIICFCLESDTFRAHLGVPSSTPSGNMTSNKLVLPIELKPPHKLPRNCLKQGLHPMDLLPDVINVNKISTDKDARDQQEAERRVAATTTQLFSYMVEGGVEYGLVATGEAFVFLHINLEDPGTLYYHCLDPTTDIPNQVHGNDLLSQSAVGQILAFVLQALESSQSNKYLSKQDTIFATLDELDIWPRTPTQDTSPSAAPPRSPSSSSPPYAPPKGQRKTSKLPTRQALPRKAKSKSSCNPGGDYPTRQDESRDPTPPELDPQPAQMHIATHTTRMTHQEGTSTSGSGRSGISKSSSSNRPQKSEQQQQHAELFYPYCSPACILDLAGSSFPSLDRGCPNYRLHSDYITTNNLSFNRRSFLRLLQAQLHETRDRYIYPLGIQGAVGVVFKVVLRCSGYVIIAKGSVDMLRDHLAYESCIYTHLKPLQGIYIPVCLGLIHLSRPYYYDIGVQIKHLLLLSYGGDPLPAHIADIISPGDRWWASEHVSQTVDTIVAHGVDHQDIRVPNLLWDKHHGRVILIDFERSVIVDQKKRKRE
ncbi:hypothetical protein GP486_006410 [Trichoglossum hirsutum]|uniref:Protein kinase domain-containing protein n=1 Tax=Trichoglossum hirsutum TaxID=265104 RepID=A0A9P8L5L8_9PEZI|nr:hypothetical protein GP486_006410 [Trichoglossum hirsutum]